MELKCVSVEEAVMPYEMVAIVKTASGQEEEVLAAKELVNQEKKQLLGVEAVDVDGDKRLIELPRQTSSGQWRLWVGAALLP